MVKKYFVKTTISLIIAILALGVLSVIPASASKPVKEPIDRAVFIHYPRGFEHLPDASDARPNDSPARNLKSNINCPDPNTCPDYKYSGIKWTLMPVHYVIDPTNADGVNPNDIQTAVELGFNIWNLAETNAAFVNDNSSAAISGDPTTSRDSLNSLLFRDISAKYPNALAVTFVWYTRFGKRIVEADTVFNDGYAWSYTDPATAPLTGPYGNYGNTGLSSYDVGNIAIHEQGHWLMLNDLYNSRDAELTMYGYGAAGELKKISLGWGDILGVQKIY